MGCKFALCACMHVCFCCLLRLFRFLGTVLVANLPCLLWLLFSLRYRFLYACSRSFDSCLLCFISLFSSASSSVAALIHGLFGLHIVAVGRTSFAAFYIASLSRPTLSFRFPDLAGLERQCSTCSLNAARTIASFNRVMHL